jgi:hypothetical protein
MRRVLLGAVVAGVVVVGALPAAAAPERQPVSIRFATFNASLNRNVEGQLVSDLSTPNNAQARTVADLRAAGIGISRVLLAHDGTQASSDVFEWLLTMLSTGVELDVVRVSALESAATNGHITLDKDRQWAERLGRILKILADEPQTGSEIVRMSREGSYDAIVLPAASASWTPSSAAAEDWMSFVLQHAPCSVFIAVHPTIPREVVG